MRISEQEHAAQIRMSTVAAEVERTLLRLVCELPDLTRVEMAIALNEVVGRKLMHQRFAQVREGMIGR